MLHTQKIMITAILASAALSACMTDPNGNTPASQLPSVTTIEADAQLQTIAPGVSVGDYANQHVVYVSSQAGADWLADSTLREYNAVLEQYTQLGDTSLLPRLNQLQSTLHATEANSGSSFLITSTADSDLLAGASCAGGDGSTCSCAPGCSCISADRGCGCNCPVAQ